MAIRKVQIERFSITSPKSFETVTSKLRVAVGQPDIAQFLKETKGALTYADLEKTVKTSLGRTDLMLFMELDLGSIIRKESGLDAPKMVRFMIGNPLIMKEIAKHVPDAGSYAPVTILVDERSDGVHISYDRMTSLLAPYSNQKALAVAQELDSKIESLMQESAK